MTEVTDPADVAALKRVREICLRFSNVNEAELQKRPLFRVGRFRFAIFNGASSPPRPRWDGCGRSLHFLSDPLERDALRADARFALSPHHGQRGWLMLRIDDDAAWDEIAELLESAYRVVTRAST